MPKFKLHSKFKPTREQEIAIESLTNGVLAMREYQVLLGVTGSGKTFTIANVIQNLQRPTLIISHNKTLAAQLYQEFRDFFPKNAVSYFVSYYDYYQPEAYIPSTDTYIEKDSDINELIDKLRLATTTNLLTRNDTIVIASVSCIYNIGSAKEYGNFILELAVNAKLQREQIVDRLIDLQYERGDFGFHRGTFRVRGDTIDIYPAYQDEGVRVELGSNVIKKITFINPVSGSPAPTHNAKHTTHNFILYPAKHYMTDPNKNKGVFAQILGDLTQRTQELQKQNKILEAQRLKQRVTYDLEMIQELGYVKGIENYSRYFDGRRPGEEPYTLLDYFPECAALNDSPGTSKKDWLLIVDESHITFPQIRGMYNGDLARKKILIDYGFRLPAALDNRPLMFEEFMRRIPGFIALSATPSEWEKSMATGTTDLSKTKGQKYKTLSGIVEQLVRPTGIPDPEVEIRPTENQVANVILEIQKIASKGQRALVTTLTKKTAEDLSDYITEKGLKVCYLHSDVDTLERTDILDNLRRGKYDAIIGVNLLREGLDLPEVSLVAILDADKEGFLRSAVSLIQTMGRAARHVEGRVILYADKNTGSIDRALSEVKRRRGYQIKMNKKYKITPRSIEKPFREKLVEEEEESKLEKLFSDNSYQTAGHLSVDTESLTPMDKRRLIKRLREDMRMAAEDLNFELAAEIRDKIKEIER